MKKFLNIIIILAVISTMFIGCSKSEKASESEVTGDTDTKTEATETAEPEKEITLKVAYMPNYSSMSEVVAGIKTGFFKEEGLNIELVEFADGPTIIAAMESGSIDFGFIGPGAHKLAIQGRAKVIAIDHYGNADELIGNTEKGVSTIDDLKGKTIAIASGTTSETILDLTLEKAGLTRDDVTIMDMDASAIVTAMLSGSVDACATWSPNTFAIKKEMGDKAVMITNNKTFVDVSPSICSWIASPAYVEDHSDIVLKFTRALYKAMDYRADNLEEVSEWVAEQGAMDLNSVLEQIYDGDWIKSDYIATSIADGTLEAVYKAQQMNFIKSGAVEKEVPVSDYVLFQNMIDAAK